jgi:DNA replication protein DnaC
VSLKFSLAWELPPGHRGWLVVAQTGVSKSHLIIGMGMRAVESGYRMLYRSAFDLLEDIAGGKSYRIYGRQQREKNGKKTGSSDKAQ